MALGVCLLRNEFDYSDRDSAVGLMLIVHITSYGLEYVKILTGLCGHKLVVLKFTINFLNCALYQAAIFYCQVKYLNASFDAPENFTLDSEIVRKNNNSLKWLMLEISFYYMTVVLTIVFLVLQHFFKLEIPTRIDEFPVLETIIRKHGKNAINDEEVNNAGDDQATND